MGTCRCGGAAVWSVPDAVSAVGRSCEHEHPDDSGTGAAGSGAERAGVCPAAGDNAMAECGGVSLHESADSGWDWDRAVRERARGRRGGARDGELLAIDAEE